MVKEDEMAKRLRSSWPLSLIAVQAFLFLFFMVVGCRSTQERPDRQESYEKISFSEILRSPEQYRGKVVRLGGVILDVVNKEEGSTLEILEQPLNWRGRPKPDDDSGGRFIAVFGEFLDKEIYRMDRQVTIIGEITGMKTAPIGEGTYNYPLLSGREIRLWKDEGFFDRTHFHIGIGVSGGSGGTDVGVGVGTSF